MTTVIVIIIVLAIVAVGIVLWRRSQARARAERSRARDERIAAAEAPGSRLRDLKVSDVVGMDDALWLVEGTLRMDEDGFRWQEHLLVEGERRTWLSVEDDEGRTVVERWERLCVGGLAPDGDEVEHEGVTYRLEERGRARYTAEGTTGAPPAGDLEYADYRAGDRALGFERYTASGSWEASLGTEVAEHALDVYPGGGTGPAR